MAEPGSRPPPSSFRKRFVAREPLTGTFIKTPTRMPSRSSAARVRLRRHRRGARAVRSASNRRGPAGCAGVRHGRHRARAVGHSGRYPPGARLRRRRRAGPACLQRRQGARDRRRLPLSRRQRGYSGSSRAGGYGAAKMWDHVARSDAATTVIAMIEDPEALDDIDSILARRGNRRRVHRPWRSDGRARGGRQRRARGEGCRRHGDGGGTARGNKPVCVMVGGPAEAKGFKDLGASAFIVSSDQGFLRKIAGQTLSEMAELHR